MKNPEYIVGIDEVGRGPLAGPVSIGVFLIHRKNLDKIAMAHDSKQVSQKGREEICKEFKRLKSDGFCDYVIVSKSSLMINRHGISKCIKDSISQGLAKLNIDPKNTEIKLDGLLYAPKQYINQETITKGDSKEKVIGAASIVAKVTRDKFMLKQAEKYPEYGFESHKGYGTKKHREAIQKIGVCPLHRDLWVRNILNN
jgi:ribonuclease HII